MPTPPVTVLLAVYNGAPHLSAALASILAQTKHDFELLVVDDASTDGTPEILRACRDQRLRVVRNEMNLGLTASLNRGLALARGEYIARHDADDLSAPERLRLQLAFLQAHPAVAAVGSQGRILDEAERFQEKRDLPLSHASIRFAHLFDNALLHSAVTFRKAAVLEAGGYDEEYRVSQDYELWSRLGERHALANLPQRLISLRQRQGSLTQTHGRPDLIRRIQSAHYERLFPGKSPTPAELDLIGAFRTGLTAETVAPFERLLQELLARYCAACPAARAGADFRRTVAMLYLRLGYNLLDVSRAKALAAIAQGISQWPPRIFAFPWPRVVLLAAMGHRARQLYRFFRPPSAS